VPSFDISVPDLQTSGPILQVFIGPSREMIAAMPDEAAIAPISVSALIDTGAASTVITSATAALLGLRSVGTVPVHTPTTIEPVWCRQFHINVYFSAAFAIENILAIEGALTGQAFQCLLGRDVLSRGRFGYDGIANRFTVTF
jgi:gag-polyprotein putative aspartyl protease